MQMNPLAPSGTVTVAASTTTASATLVGGGNSILITNPTNGVAFFRTGTGTQTAVLTDTPVLSGQSRAFTIPYNHTDVGVILFTGATAGNVYVTRGEGA